VSPLLRHLWAGSYAPTSKYVPPVATNGIVFRVANRGLGQADRDGVINSCTYAPGHKATDLPLSSRVYLYERIAVAVQGQ
jgi:hypothetical protein